MTRSWGWVALLIVVAVIAIGASMGLGYVSLEGATIVLLGVTVVSWMAFRMAKREDPWFPVVALAGYGAKIAGAYVHFWAVDVLYGGVADAFGYHDRALALVEVWRNFQIPKSDFGSAGTRFVTEAVAFLYTPYKPSLLGGFLIFATLGFFGQLLLYAAFRRALPSGRLRLYAIGIFFLPSLVFWPSTIGKDALMLLFLGLLGYGISRFLLDYRMRWFLVLAAGGAGSVAIRPHVAALAAGAIASAVVLGRRPQVRAAGLRWGLMAAAAVLAAALVATQASDALGVDISGQNLDPLLQDIERNTSRGGSAVEGEAVLTLRQLPGGVMRVLFRPLPFEADTTQGMLSAIESTLILVVVLWRSPRILLAFRRLRHNPYLLFSMLFVVGFVIAFSAIFNLGILARQRTQALPFLLALIVGMGWLPEAEPDETVENQLVRTK